MHTDGDYISRSAAIKRFTFATLDCLGMEPTICASDVVLALQSIPAADVRPVVTCGECKYWELSKIEPPFPVCTYVCGVTFVRSAGDFCSLGEKREES